MNQSHLSIVPPQQAWDLVKRDGIFIDVRSGDEVAGGMLPNAIHIPHTEIAARIAELEPHKSKNVVIYCAVGGRAQVAQQVLEAHGFTKVFNAGGFKDLSTHQAE